MAIDQDLLLCSNTAVVGNALIGNVIDLVNANVKPGTGPRPMYLDGRVTAVFSDSGDNSSATLYLQSSPYEAINSVTTNTAVGTIATNAAIGDRIGPFTLPSGINTQQYMSLYSVVAGGNFTTGSITAWLTPDLDARRDFSVGYTGPTTS